MPDQSIPREARRVTHQAIGSLRAGRHVIVKAHAGAGKTGGRDSGTVCMARTLTDEDNLRVALLVAQNDQLYDSVDRLLRHWPGASVTLVPASSSWQRTPDHLRLGRLRPAGLFVARGGSNASRADQQAHQRLKRGPGLFAMTLDKFRFLAADGHRGGNDKVTEVDPFDVVIVDEAWMARATFWEDHLQFLARQSALVGDAGQILPWLPGGAYYPGMAGSPIQPLPELLADRRAGRVDTYELDVTRRNPSHTTAITGRLPAYAGDPTRPMYDASEVGVTLLSDHIPRDQTDRVVDRMVSSGVVLHELMPGLAPQNDPLVAATCAKAADRLLTRGALLAHPQGERTLTPADVAILVAHHSQRAAVEAALKDCGRTGPNAPRVATFNTIQGATVAVSIVWHPLSGRADVSEFHVDTGRLTVGLTRHTHGCVLIGRGDIGDRLFGAAVSDDLEGDARDRRHAGLSAHRMIWESLAA